jgi:hypothetical protein
VGVGSAPGGYLKTTQGAFSPCESISNTDTTSWPKKKLLSCFSYTFDLWGVILKSYTALLPASRLEMNTKPCFPHRFSQFWYS